MENNNNLYKKLATVNTAYLEVAETHEAARHATKNGFASIDLLVDL